MNENAPTTPMTQRAALIGILDGLANAAVAVSGGVDSLTLATLAHRRKGSASVMFHAVSPAVPPDATERVRALARQEGWQLRVIDAGEFADADYRRNPVNRCFFCKSNLYRIICRCASSQILSGTNVDDLGEYRPGLDAARAHQVRHPYVEAGLRKADVRRLARELGLPDVAELPASPCLSSRVETGIAIQPDVLRSIDKVEKFVASILPVRTVRCRVRATGVVVELDAPSRKGLTAASEEDIRRKVLELFQPVLNEPPDVTFADYVTGSAFLQGLREQR